MLLRIIVIILLSNMIHIINTSSTYELKSRINTEQFYKSPNIPANRIYSIDVKRVDSTNAEQVSRCWSVPRMIRVVHKSELFRLSKGESSSRKQKVYQKLTSLSQQENIIQEFEIVGERIFVVTTDGSGYFISISDPQQVVKVQTKLFDNPSNGSLDMITLKQYKQRVLIITTGKVILCRFQKSECEIVPGYEPSEHIRGAQIFEENGRFIVFIIQATNIATYELTANGQFKNKQTYDSTFFGIKKASFRAVARGELSSVYVLDDVQGVWEMIGRQGLSKGFTPNEKPIFQQFGCYQMITENQAQGMILACNPSENNYFVMNLVKSRQFSTVLFEPLETVFLQEQLYQISAAENILLGRIYSGVKLFWSSKQIGNPYPYFYRNAGSVYLHNAIQSKLKIINEVKTIFIAAEDELLRYQLKSIDPYIACYSPIPVNQQYKLKYDVQCQQQLKFIGKQNVCAKEEFLKFETWEHKQVKVSNHILPFLLSLVGAAIVGLIVRKLHRQNSQEVEQARRKYNIQEDQISL